MSRSRFYCKWRAVYLAGEADYFHDAPARIRERIRRHDIRDGELEWEDHRGDYASDEARIAMIHDVRHRGIRRWLTRRDYRRIRTAWADAVIASLIASPSLISSIRATSRARGRPQRTVADFVARVRAQRVRVSVMSRVHVVDYTGAFVEG